MQTDQEIIRQQQMETVRQQHRQDQLQVVQHCQQKILSSAVGDVTAQQARFQELQSVQAETSLNVMVINNKKSTHTPTRKNNKWKPLERLQADVCTRQRTFEH